MLCMDYGIHSGAGNELKQMLKQKWLMHHYAYEQALFQDHTSTWVHYVSWLNTGCVVHQGCWDHNIM